MGSRRCGWESFALPPDNSVRNASLRSLRLDILKRGNECDVEQHTDEPGQCCCVSARPASPQSDVTMVSLERPVSPMYTFPHSQGTPYTLDSFSPTSSLI